MTKAKNGNGAERAVLVTTAHRGVFFGYAHDTAGATIKLRAARNCIYWGPDNKGFLGLASMGVNYIRMSAVNAQKFANVYDPPRVGPLPSSNRECPKHSDGKHRMRLAAHFRGHECACGIQTHELR